MQFSLGKAGCTFFIIDTHYIAAGISYIISAVTDWGGGDYFADAFATGIVGVIYDCAIAFCNPFYFAIYGLVYLGNAFCIVFNEIANFIVNIIIGTLCFYIAVITGSGRCDGIGYLI